MKHVSILIPRGHTSVVNIEGTHQIFNEVNSVLKAMDKPPMFKVELVGISKETSQRNGLFKIDADVLINDVKKNGSDYYSGYSWRSKNNDAKQWRIYSMDHKTI